ncbi:MAG: sel1 repeat family protein [Deltaproteobacteria bacterium]|nr:sel1 repeat family protein [Deltaproteobacteria bacterium]
MKVGTSVVIALLISVVFPIMANTDQLEDANTAIEIKDYKKAFELLQPLAEEGNTAAQTRLGALYVNGQGVEKDLDKGLSWIMKAATQGDETAKRIAFSLHLELVNQGDTTVMYNCGYMCLNDWGGEHDANDCLGWLENAGKIGHEKSAKLLARIYTEGLHGITPDEEKATYWSNVSEGFAAGIDGTWSGEVPGFGGQPLTLTFTFQRDDDTLSGTTRGFGGQDIRIRNGQIDGNDFSFTVQSSFFGTKSTTSYTGIFLGDRLKLTYTTKMSAPRRRGPGTSRGGGGESPPMSFVAKRVQ